MTTGSSRHIKTTSLFFGRQLVRSCHFTAQAIYEAKQLLYNCFFVLWGGCCLQCGKQHTVDRLDIGSFGKLKLHAHGPRYEIWGSVGYDGMLLERLLYRSIQSKRLTDADDEAGYQHSTLFSI